MIEALPHMYTQVENCKASGCLIAVYVVEHWSLKSKATSSFLDNCQLFYFPLFFVSYSAPTMHIALAAWSSARAAIEAQVKVHTKTMA